MIYLASQSPRRRELLTQLGVAFEVISVDVHEARVPGESPQAYILRVSREKAGAGLFALGGVSGAVVLGADTDVVLNDHVLGKPNDAADAAKMLRALSGTTHDVYTAVWLVSSGREEHRLSHTRVRFSELSETDIRRYIATGEPFGRAGAYAIQGFAGGFIAGIEGSFSGVMGLPVYETCQLLRNFNIPVWSE